MFLHLLLYKQTDRDMAGDVIIKISNNVMEGINMPSDNVTANNMKNKAQRNHKKINLTDFILNLPC